MTFVVERDAVQNPRKLYETFLKKFFIKNTPISAHVKKPVLKKR